MPLRLVAIATFLAVTAQAAEVTFRFFDENGAELSFAATRSRMTNGRPDELTSGTVNSETLEVVARNESYQSGGRWVTPFSAKNQALLVHWNTKSTGYSSYLLDNEGRGFDRDETFVFNERLALDSRRELERAFGARRAYRASARMKAKRADVDRCFVDLAAATAMKDRGRLGQECLDEVAVTMQLLLREYGAQVAAFLLEPVWGVTIVPEMNRTFIDEERPKIDDLVDLFAPEHRWARLVLNGPVPGEMDPAYFAELAAYAAERDVKTIGQLFDSQSQPEMTFSEFKQSVDAVLATPGIEKVTAWEVGNEVNGDWLGTEVAKKIEYAARTVKKRFPKKNTALTFFWVGVESEPKASLFNWIAANISAEIRNSVDDITLSIYVDRQPLGFLWDRVLTRLSEVFPGKRVLIGELDYRDPENDPIFHEGPKDASEEDVELRFIADRYGASFATPQAQGGGFWWYYDDHMVGKTARWQALKDFYRSVYAR